MKKIILIIILLFFISINIVKAVEWSYLDSLTIENALKDIEFKPEKIDYLVIIPKEDNELNINYKSKPGYKVEIEGNRELIKGSHVFIRVSNEESEVVYTLTIDKVKKDNTEDENRGNLQKIIDNNNKLIHILKIGLCITIFISITRLFIKHSKRHRK